MTYEVMVTARAQSDLQSTKDFIAGHAPEVAERWYKELLTAMLKLETNPLGRPLAPESHHVSFELRELIIRTKSGKANRALFTVVGNQVRVLAVRRPGQRLAQPTDLQ